MKNWKMLLSLLVAYSVVVLGCVVPGVAWGCAALITTEADVQVNRESAVIVWDEQHHIEHFIRQADFSTTAGDMGFLVPTPSLPTLANADSGVFSLLEKVANPPTQDNDEVDTSAARSASASGGVEVLNTQRVGDYDAAVLQADDAHALNQWLAQHHYVVRPQFTSWLAPYIARHWKITAFKIAKALPQGTSISLSPVRMSFATDHPFYPYREPAYARSMPNPAPRSLRVYMLSQQSMDGTLGYASHRSWPGRVTATNIPTDSLRGELAHYLSLEPNQLPANMQLTAFQDDSSPRPGFDDVYFWPASRRNLHLMQLLAALFIGCGGLWLLDQKKRQRVSFARQRAVLDR